MSDSPNGGQSSNYTEKSDGGKEDPQPPECRDSGLDDDKEDPSENEKSLELLDYDNVALTSATMAKARSSTSALLTDAGGGQSTPNAPSVPFSSSLPRTRHIRQLERPRREDHEFFARDPKLFGLGPVASVLGTGHRLLLRDDAPSAHVANQQQQLQQPQPRARSTDAMPEGGASGAVDEAGPPRNEGGEEADFAQAGQRAMRVDQQYVEGGQTRQQAAASRRQQQTAAAHSQQPAIQVQHSHNRPSSPAEGGGVGEVKVVVDPRVSSGEEEEDDH